MVDDIELNPDWRILTAFFFISRIICDTFGKSLSVFDYALSSQLSISLTQYIFSVTVCIAIGSLLALAFGYFNEKYKFKSLKIFTIYSIISGISILFFSLMFIIDNVLGNINSYVYVYIEITILSLLMLISGMSLTVLTTITMNISTQHCDDESKHSQIISILATTWTFASLFYIIVGYTIEYKSWLLYIIFAIYLIFISPLCINIILFGTPNYSWNSNSNTNTNINSNSVSAQAVYNIDIDRDDDDNDDDPTNDSKDNINIDNDINNSEQSRLLSESIFQLNKSGVVFQGRNLNILIILLSSIFWIGISTGSSDVMVNPLFMGLYNLSITNSGICSLSIFFGEITASIILIKYSDQLNHFIIATMGLISKFVASILFIINFALIFDIDGNGNGNGNDNDIDNIGSLCLTLISLVIWYYGWECFYVVQFISILKLFSDITESQKRLLFLLVTFAAMLGRISGMIVSVLMWDNNDHDADCLLSISIIWFITTIFGAIFYLVIKCWDNYNDKIEN